VLAKWRLETVILEMNHRRDGQEPWYTDVSAMFGSRQSARITPHVSCVRGCIVLYSVSIVVLCAQTGDGRYIIKISKVMAL
jgi:hypothetical protein